MKVLIFSDTHGNEGLLEKIIAKSRECDALVCCGDLGEFGTGVGKSIDILKKSGKKLFITHGNHEMISEVLEHSDGESVVFLHEDYFILNDVAFAAFGGGGFNERDERLEKWASKIKPKLKGKTVLFTHAPPYYTVLDKLPFLGHRGSKSIREAIELLKPNLFACGHFHDTFLKKEKLGSTLLINPGTEGMIVEI
jgi:uncharacterized protein